MPRTRTPKRPSGPSGVAAARRDVGRVRDKASIGSRLSASPSSLAAAEALCTGSIVAYDLMGVQGKKLPRPGPIVASMGFYALLGLAAAASETFRPAVVASGWVLALAVLVTGKRGQGLVKILADFAKFTQKIGGGANA